MTKICPVCENPIEDGADVAAVVKSKFRLVPSKGAYAIDKPTICVEVIHWGCTDYPKMDDTNN